MKLSYLLIGFTLTALLGSCNAGGPPTTRDGPTVPSALDTMETPLHPGMVDSAGVPRIKRPADE